MGTPACRARLDPFGRALFLLGRTTPHRAFHVHRSKSAAPVKGGPGGTTQETARIRNVDLYKAALLGWDASTMSRMTPHADMPLGLGLGHQSGHFRPAVSAENPDRSRCSVMPVSAHIPARRSWSGLPSRGRQHSGLVGRGGTRPWADAIVMMRRSAILHIRASRRRNRIERRGEVDRNDRPSPISAGIHHRRRHIEYRHLLTRIFDHSIAASHLPIRRSPRCSRTRSAAE